MKKLEKNLHCQASVIAIQRVRTWVHLSWGLVLLAKRENRSSLPMSVAFWVSHNGSSPLPHTDGQNAVFMFFPHGTLLAWTSDPERQRTAALIGHVTCFTDILGNKGACPSFCEAWLRFCSFQKLPISTLKSQAKVWQTPVPQGKV